MDIIEIKSHSKNYKVVFDTQLTNLQHYVIDLSCVFLIDKKVLYLYEKHFFNHIPQSQVIAIDALEENKDYYAIGKLYPLLTGLSAKKNLTIIAIGGGIIQDIAGFIASVLYRGIRWIFIPTTLLAQADSCIGAKTSINFGTYKNLLGTFWAPDEVWLSTAFLDTLSTKDFYSGIGEIVKLFLIDGEASLCKIADMATLSEKDLRNNMVELLKQALLIKKRFIEVDEYDKGVRNILNFGHCIGHAIESVSGYTIPHGQAVTLGMIWANIVSTKLNLLTEKKQIAIYNTYLKKAHTISKNEISFTAEQIIDAMKKDKKREGEGLAIILMDDHGSFKHMKDVKASVITETIGIFFHTIHF